MTARRPIFRDGERLTAQRLNEAFGFVDDRVRRAQLGTAGAGVAAGYELSIDASGPAVMLRVEPGLAIDGAGRSLVSAGSQLFSIRQIEDQTGPLPAGARVRIQVHGRTPAPAPTDPCAHLRPPLVDERPALRFEIAETTTGLFPRSGSAATLATSAALPAWSELSSAVAHELAVTLGSLALPSASGGYSVSMAERQGLAPRADALRNSLGQPVMVLRDRAGGAQIELLARTFGGDVTATRLGAVGAASAAGVAPSDARVLLLQGGAASAPAGRAGTAAVPIELDPEGGPVDAAGVPLEMAEAPAGGPAVRARRARARPSQLVLGVSAAPAYAAGDTTIVPLATAGLVEVRVRAGEAGVPLGALLEIADDRELAVVTRAPAVVVARAAQRSDQRGGVVPLLAWVSPAYLFTAGPGAPPVD